ncbi:GTPase-activating protein GYP5 [Daldinia childiae]|uniref:GTPase-activating protein GYP5 n=1 Tax=Daldinia childiae TaxID=326645 RepID=UPI001445BA12|nr:GTPase-activating protein GYP5 [Daldinia childiae]KAF3071203.1 GTPase-activating protein GYP5 [Daldinia childiae]
MSGPEEPHTSEAAPQVIGSPTPSDKDTSRQRTKNEESEAKPNGVAVEEKDEEKRGKGRGKEKEEEVKDNVKESLKEIDLGDEKDEKDEKDDEVAKSSPTTRSARNSNASLDNVDLSDGVTEQPKEEPPIVAAKQPSKKLSLGNIGITMPWSPSPPATESPPKTSPNPTTAPAAAPAPPTRKITGPFSWLSRNSTHKEKDAVTSPPVTAAVSRRNTASSIATLTSNPEMMLSKLDEENEGDGGPRLSRNSLKDRFKYVRMREEAGISLNPDDDDKASTLGVLSPTGESYPDVNFNLPPPSPLPPNPDTNLAPGTVSGVSAGPSTIADAQVDWDLWQSVVYEGPAAVARTNPEELNKAIVTGIPNVIRGVVWQVLGQSKSEDLERVYRELLARGSEKNKDRNSNATSVSISSNGNLSSERDAVASSASSIQSEVSGASGKKASPPSSEPSEAALKAQALAAAERKRKEKEDAVSLQKLERAIKRDIGARTSFSKYAAAAGLQDGLFGVCKAYALFDEAVGYAQGMNFLIMPLLFNMSEDEAFGILVRLMNQYKLRDLFIQDMPGLHMHLYQFERLLEDFEPALYCHLHRRGISPHLYATQWFLTLFAYRFPLQLVLRIYDLIFSEGLSAILKFGIVLMQKNSAALLDMTDMGQLTNFLRDKLFDVYIDQSPSAGSILENGFFGSSSSSADKEVYRADQLVQDACEVKITPEMLKAYTAEWEEKTKAEKEKEKELADLKTTNLSQAIKIRKLEERLEASDREQATVTTDLVHTKIENEELKDQNESLTGQVKELRHVIEQQPAELEGAWKLEREDLMKRNEKVHEENRRLEKELQELEEELVQTKMRYAEINSQHETLQKRWAELKRQFA